MARLVSILIVLIVLIVFIALNQPYRTTVNVFGYTVEDAPSVIVIIASVAAGFLLSISVSLTSHVAKRRRNGLRLRAAAAEHRVRELAEREGGPGAGASQASAAAPGSGAAPRARRGLRSPFGRRRRP